jgi:Ser/Thr protein kinase RdoA (MazF antagonist)
MEPMIYPQILKNFGLKKDEYQAEKYGSGLINRTFRLQHLYGNSDKDYIIQRINTEVFQDPWTLAQNHRLAADYLAEHSPDYLFPAPVQTISGNDLLEWNREYWRMLPFVGHTISMNEADKPEQAYEAARQFGMLARKLSGIDPDKFRPTIPDFHNLSLRQRHFQKVISEAESKRKEQASELIEAFQGYAEIPATYGNLKTDPDFPDRLMHHDTKINNVLFDEKTYKGVCVIDLDTLMPGKIISDLGDMIRTYVSPVSEEETDFSKIEIREPYYNALMKGYLSELSDYLTKTEKNALFYAGDFMIYMQGIRFLTDYLNGDVYYSTQYPLHNFNRAKNQLVLLEKMHEKEDVLRKIISKYVNVS